LSRIFRQAGKITFARIGDFSRSLYPVFQRLMRTMLRAAAREHTAPAGKQSTRGMSEAQRIDFKAACDGKITWRQYFAKWGSSGPSL
jgi:hypothetical protein